MFLLEIFFEIIKRKFLHFDSDCVPKDYALPKKNVERDYNKENIQFNYITLSKYDPDKTSTHTYSCPSKEIEKILLYMILKMMMRK